MQTIFQRFVRFDRMLGPALVRIVYYIGAIVILGCIALTMLSGVFAIFGGNFGGGLMQLLAAPAVGAVALVYWRFISELFMLAFLSYERMGEIRDRLPDYSQF